MSSGGGAVKQRTSRLGRPSRIWRSLAVLAPCAAAFGACDRPQYTYSDDVPVKGVGASSNLGGGVILAGTASGGSAFVDPCALDRSVGVTPIFATQAISANLPAKPELYFQLNDADARALRQGAALIPPPPAGPSTSLLTALLSIYVDSATPERRPLLEGLRTRFKSTRALWPNPWALRLIDHPSSEHMNPVRVVLKPNAWIVRLVDATANVLDLANEPVSLDRVLAAPERIAAIYYEVDDQGVASSLAGAQCANAKRELLLGNEAMVESFELGTPQILARLNADIDALNAFFKIVRPCPTSAGSAATFHELTACQAWHYFDTSTERSAYQWSLSNPVELYKPTAQNLSSLIVALQNDRFEPDTFVGAPSLGAGGDGAGGQANGAAGFSQGGI